MASRSSTEAVFISWKKSEKCGDFFNAVALPLSSKACNTFMNYMTGTCFVSFYTAIFFWIWLSWEILLTSPHENELSRINPRFSESTMFMSCLTMHFCHAFSYHISCHFNSGPVKLVSMRSPNILLTCETMPYNISSPNVPTVCHWKIRSKWVQESWYPEKSELQSDRGEVTFNKASLAYKSGLLHAALMESSCSLCYLTGETFLQTRMTVEMIFERLRKFVLQSAQCWFAVGALRLGTILLTC